MAVRLVVGSIEGGRVVRNSLREATVLAFNSARNQTRREGNPARLPRDFAVVVLGADRVRLVVCVAVDLPLVPHLPLVVVRQDARRRRARVLRLQAAVVGKGRGRHGQGPVRVQLVLRRAGAVVSSCLRDVHSQRGGVLTVPCCQKMTAVGQPGWEAVRVFFLISWQGPDSLGIALAGETHHSPGSGTGPSQSSRRR